MQKRNIKDTSKLTNLKLKKILKETNYSKYYEHIPLIISKLCSNSKPLIIPENTQITSNTDTNQKLLIEDVIDFSASSSLDPTVVSVYQVSNGNLGISGEQYTAWGADDDYVYTIIAEDLSLVIVEPSEEASA